MKTAVIVCNGEFPKKEYPLYLLKSADLIICCDGARNIRRLQRLGLQPALIVGDMDSTPPALQAAFSDRLVGVSEQDDNDLAKAFSLLRERYPEVTDIHILGAGGRNEAHTVGNLGWLMEWERRSLAETGLGLAARGVNVEMVSDYSTAFAVSPPPDEGRPGWVPDAVDSGTYDSEISAAGISSSGGTCSAVPAANVVELYVGKGRKVSFFSTDPDLRICSEGLRWPLDGVNLSRWWSATLNRASADKVILRFSHAASLLVILD